MKTIKIGTFEVRGDLKLTKTQLKKKFSKYLSEDEIEELAKKLKK